MTDFLIYGAGAIGSLMGFILSERLGPAIENVALLGRKEHIQRIRENGLRVKLPESSPAIRFQHTFCSLQELSMSGFLPDMVVLCVKTCSIPQVVEELKESGILEGALKDSDFLLLMNGMGNREQFGIHTHRVYEGITIAGVVVPQAGEIELKGKGKTILEDGIRGDIKRSMRERFEEKGFEIEFASNFKDHQWNKLFANAVINPITAITRRSNGVVLSSPLRDLAEAVIEECATVARMDGFDFHRKDVLEFVLNVASRTSMNTSSMLQDILRGKQTEIESINGYVVTRARKHGVPVPVNETLYRLVKAMEGTSNNSNNGDSSNSGSMVQYSQK